MSHVLDLGVDVATGVPGTVWALGFEGQSELGVSTRLAATADLPGIWQPLDCDLVEVTWRQGTSDTPRRVVNRPDPGTLQLVAIDPDLSLVPVADLYSGLRPGRGIRVVDRDTGDVLYYGWVETCTWDLHPGNPLHHLTVTAVDPVTRLSRIQVDAGRNPESAADRVTWLLDTYAPEYPYVVDPAATHVVAKTYSGGLWSQLEDAADAELGWLWARRDGTVVLTAAATVATAPATWVVDDPCAPVSVPSAVWDAMGWGTEWVVTRVDPGTGVDPVPQRATNATADSYYGRWVADPLESYPVTTDADALRAASVAASWRGWPRLTVPTVAVNVAAAAHTDSLPSLLDLIRSAELGDHVEASVPAGLPASPLPMALIGWEWTWTAAGGLAGSLFTELPAGSAITGGYWVLGVKGSSELGVRTVLAQGVLP